MIGPNEFQVFVGADGKPAFVVLPYPQYQHMPASFAQGRVPNEVVNISMFLTTGRNEGYRRNKGHQLCVSIAPGTIPTSDSD